jgi:hypothetical protein
MGISLPDVGDIEQIAFFPYMVNAPNGREDIEDNKAT